LADARQAEVAAPPSCWPCCTLPDLGGYLAEEGPAVHRWSLVEFWAPDCLFSRLLLPVRVQLHASHGARLRLLCCVLDSVTTGAASYGATALPALVLFDGTRRERRWLGAIDPTLLQYHVNVAMGHAAS
jgi:hypothetical protein